MRVKGPLAVLAATLTVGGLVVAAPRGGGAPAGGAAADAGSARGGANACTKVRAYARPTAYGFTHVVELTNQCKKTVACDVSSDVNPTPSKAVIEVGKREEVVTFLESPASAFTARVECDYADAKK